MKILVTKMLLITLKAIFHSQFSTKTYQKEFFCGTLKIACNCHYSQWPQNTAKNGSVLATGFTFYINTNFIMKIIPIPRSPGRPFGLSCK